MHGAADTQLSVLHVNRLVLVADHLVVADDFLTINFTIFIVVSFKLTLPIEVQDDLI